MKEKIVNRSKWKWGCVIGVLIIAIFCGIRVICGSRVKPLPEKLWTEMQAAWLDEYKVKIPWDGENGYYGTYQGDVVVRFESGETQAITEKIVAGETFWWPTGFEISVYHDGKFLDLEDAYAKGWLTQKDIKVLADVHREQVDEQFPRADE